MYSTIAIDAMGGDHGPSIVVPACLFALRQYPKLHIILVGDEGVLQQELTKHKVVDSSRITIHNASQVVEMHESPSQALRMKKDSSMRVAINLVKDGRAQACVSAGNTGALMATAKFVLKTLPGIDRPAIIAALPTIKSGTSVRVLDLGANVECSAENLLQFAVMGSVLNNAVDGIANPRVGLLNIGEEEIKGNELVKQATQLLSNCQAINYIGYVEGDAIYKGSVDVVVCDGFVGNAMLKSSEGMAKMIGQYIKEAFMRNWLTRLSALAALHVLKSLKSRIDPAHYNGATLIGLQGIVIKSHGSANSQAFANAVKQAVLEIENNVPELIGQRVTISLDKGNTE